MHKYRNRKQLFCISASNVMIAFSLIATTPSYATNLNSIFFVSKSDNGNQVHYGVKINPDCSFKTSKPVYPYWKLANGRLEGLLRIEVPAFGIASQSVSGNEVVIEVNSLRGRGLSKPITIQSTPKNQGCQISAFTIINGQTNRLQRVHIDLTRHGLLGLGGTVHSVTFYGADGEERIVCRRNCRF